MTFWIVLAAIWLFGIPIFICLVCALAGAAERRHFRVARATDERIAQVLLFPTRDRRVVAVPISRPGAAETARGVTTSEVRDDQQHA